MRKKLTRLELIDAATNSQVYIKQLRGIISLLDDKYSLNDSEDAWQVGAMLTLAHLASEELEAAVWAESKEPEVNHVA
ncbi:hypothetical protein [Pseudomonas graminis]